MWLATLALLTTPAAAQGPAQVDFTDWTSYTATQAVGSLSGLPVSLAGEIGPATKIDGSETNFGMPAFTPQLPMTDSLQVRSNGAGNPYGLSFGSATVTDPVIDVGNLYSTLTFAPGTAIEKVSDDGGLTVAGNMVSGGPRSGGNGTIRLRGRFSAVGFTAKDQPTTADSVFYLQVGAARGNVAGPAPPGFIVQVNEGGEAGLRVAPGRTARIPIEVDRNATSSGRVRLSLSGLPEGVKGEVVPAEVTGTGVSRAEIRVRALTNAPPVKRVLGKNPATLVATAVDPSVGPSQSSPFGVTVLGRLVVRVKGIELNQGVQKTSQPAKTSYSGVTLSVLKKTVARVYAGFQGSELQPVVVKQKVKGKTKKVRVPPTRPAFGMLLYGTDGQGRALPGSPLSPISTPNPTDLVRNEEGITEKERGSQTIPYSFVIPPRWRQGRLRLIARAVTASVPLGTPLADSILCVQEMCGAAPVRNLTGIGFSYPPAAAFRSLSALLLPAVYPYDDRYPLQGRIEQPSAKPPQIFQKLVALYPGVIYWLDRNNQRSVTPRYRAVEYSNYKQLLEPAQQWDARNGYPGTGTIGIYTQGENPGVTTGHTAVASGRTLSGGAMWRPVTSVAHEALHTFGFPHASTSCGAGDGEPWPIADGKLGGVGLDTSPGSGGGKGPFAVYGDGGALSTGYDLMSYCGIFSRDPYHWISVYNWQRVMRQRGATLPPPLASSAAARDLLDVRARLAGGGTVTINTVTHVRTAPRPASRSGYALVARNAAGATVATVALGVQTAEGAFGSTPFAQLEGQVPRNGVSRVDVVDPAGRVVATRSAVAQQPAVRLTAPRRGRVTGRGRSVSVRWKSSGADPRLLGAVLEASADGGASYQQVWAGPDGGRASVPTTLFSASRRARLRLTVGDGFREASASSGPFTIAARRPLVQILEPTRRARSDAGGAVRLYGSATDDRGRAITGRRLAWTAGRTVLGRGADIVAALPAGTRRVRLTARPRRGRAGSAIVAVRVRPTVPYLARVRAKRSGRRVLLTVAATQPARLSVRGRRYRVGPRARRIRVRAGKAATLRLVLSAGGKRSATTVAVRR